MTLQRRQSLEAVSMVPGSISSHCILTHNIEHERNESMMSCKRQEYSVHQNNVLEVIDNALTVQEVHCDTEEVPVERFREPQTPCSRRNIADRDDFLEAYDLHRCHNDDQVQMPSEHRAEEATDHDERPYGTRYEGLLLLLEIRRRSWFYRCLLIFCRPPFSHASVCPIDSWPLSSLLNAGDRPIAQLCPVDSCWTAIVCGRVVVHVGSAASA